MALTSAQIKALLDTIVFSPLTVKILDYVQDPNVRRFTVPFVEIENQEPKKKTENQKITTTEQIFLIHLFKRVNVAGTEEEAELSTLEDLILSKLDGSQLAGVELFLEEKKWIRSPKSKPLKYVESILTVNVRDIVGTEAGTILGAQMSITIGALSDMPLISEPRGLDNLTTEDVIRADGKRTNVCPFGDKRSVFAEIASTETRRSTLASIKSGRTYQSCTLKRTGQTNETFSALLVAVNPGGVIDDIETLIVQLEVLSS